MALRYSGTTTENKIINICCNSYSKLFEGGREVKKLTIRSESFIDDMFGHKLILSKEIIQIV